MYIFILTFTIELEAQISALKKQLKNIAQESKKREEKLTSQINELKEENNNLMNLLKLSKKKMFGASAEKVAQAYGQISLFNEAEQERTVLTPEPKIEEVVIPKHTRKKKRSYDEIYKDLPVEEVVYDIPEESKNCSKCGEPLTFLKYETRREIKMIPAQVKVVEHKKAVYVCKNCDKTGTEGTFVAAEAPKPLIEKSLVSASMLSEIINQKYCMGVPLYRLESYFKNMQINLKNIGDTMLDGSISGEYLYNYDKIRISQLRLKTQRLSFKEVEIWNIKKHMSNFYSLFYVYGGSAMIYLNNKKFEVPNHSLVVADRGDVIAGCVLENNETFRIAIDFKPELFDNVNNEEADFPYMLNSVLQLQNKNDFKLPDSYYYHDKTGYLQELFQNSLTEYINRKFRWDEIVKGNILETLILIARDLELDNKNLPPDFIQIIVDYIEVNINKRIKVKDIAQKFNYSESYVTKAFKKATGMPLAEFIRQKKIYKATSIISNDNLKIENIAEMLGFDSYATFNRCFKKYLGISPSEYKSKVKNATDWFVGMEDLITQSKL